MAITALNVAITTPETTARETSTGGKSPDAGVFFADLLANLGNNPEVTLAAVTAELAIQQGLDPKVAALSALPLAQITEPNLQAQELTDNDPVVINLLAQLGINTANTATAALSPAQAALVEQTQNPKVADKKADRKENEEAELNVNPLLAAQQQVVMAQPVPTLPNPPVVNTQPDQATTSDSTQATSHTQIGGNLSSNTIAGKPTQNPLDVLPTEKPVLQTALQPASSETPAQPFATFLQAQPASIKANAHLVDTISTPVSNQTAWSQQVGERIILMNNAGQQTAELHLTPSNLGPMQITLSINQDQTTSAMFVAHHPETRQAIQDALPQLREMFASAGLSLGQTNVSSQSQQQQNNDGSNSNSPRFSRDDAILAGDSDPENGITRVVPLRQGSGVVDLFA